MQNKALCLALILGLVLSGVPVFGAEVVVDNHHLNESVMIQSNRTLVPFRAILEALGAQVKWDGTSRTVTGRKGNRQITLKFGSKTANVNGQQMTVEVAPVIHKNRTFVPVRLVSETLGAKVDWNSENQTVYITRDQSQAMANLAVGDYERIVYSPQSMTKPEKFRVRILKNSSAGAVMVLTYTEGGDTFYQVRKLQLEGDRLRAREAESIVFYQTAASEEVFYTDYGNLLNLALEIIPELAGKKLEKTPSSGRKSEGPDFILSPKSQQLVIQYDYQSSHLKDLSAFYLPLMEVGKPNPPEGLYLQKIETYHSL